MITSPISAENFTIPLNVIPFATHIRDIKTNQYVFVNDAHAKNQGFACVNDAINLSSTDLYQHRQHRLKKLQGCLTLEKTYQESIECANQQVIQTKQSEYFKFCTLFPTGFIYVCILHKVPLFNLTKQVTAIFSFSQDQTARTDLVSLYLAYRRHYPSKLAITQFLNYLNIREHFCILPTPQESLILLLLSQDPRVKSVAHQLQLSPRTIEAHKERLRGKCKCSFSLENVLWKLRRFPCINEVSYFSIKNAYPLNSHP